jgi:hypothetical protein
VTSSSARSGTATGQGPGPSRPTPSLAPAGWMTVPGSARGVRPQRVWTFVVRRIDDLALTGVCSAVEDGEGACGVASHSPRCPVFMGRSIIAALSVYGIANPDQACCTFVFVVHGAPSLCTVTLTRKDHRFSTRMDDDRQDVGNVGSRHRTGQEVTIRS